MGSSSYTEHVTAVFTTQIEIDTRGVAWIAGSRVKVIEIVLDKLAYGWSPEEIFFQHPDLSLAQIHAALTYYYENQSRFDAEIRAGLLETQRLAESVSDPEYRRTLLGLTREL